MADVRDSKELLVDQAHGRDKRLARGLLWALLGGVLVVIIGLGVLGLQGQAPRYATENDLPPVGTLPAFTFAKQASE